MKPMYLLSIVIVITLVLLQARGLVHQRALTACIAQLEQIAQEADLNPEFEIEPFHLFPVNAENGYRPTVFGYKDREGTIVLPATFTQARSFREGKAAVADKNWYWGFIDPKGQLAIPYQFGHVSDFYGGVAAFYGIRGDKSKQGFIDKNGKIIILLKDNGGSFTTNFYGFKTGYTQSSRRRWDPLGLHGNPHPRVSLSIDCTGQVDVID